MHARQHNKRCSSSLCEGAVMPYTQKTAEQSHTLRTSAKMGTVELTGLEMTRKHALGQLLEHCSAMPLTIEALVLNRSSLGTIDLEENEHHAYTEFLCCNEK